jgi:hypothetical protein
MVNMTHVKGHHAETQCTARNFLIFHTIAVRPINNYTLLFVTGEDDIARFDSRRYNNKTEQYYPSLFLCIYPTVYPSISCKKNVTATFEALKPICGYIVAFQGYSQIIIFHGYPAFQTATFLEISVAMDIWEPCLTPTCSPDIYLLFLYFLLLSITGFG